ncbi:MAG: M23 family metallopeptidase, partial [Bacteroidales bacterium]|nr:M23 family metallopeptidase [Bacteroidales bacterium]
MNLNFVRRLGLSLLASGFAVTLLGQDLIARQAPVDRRLRAVDSIAIQRAVERDILIDPSAEIYNSWVTTKAHPYRSEEVPDSFVIDLRGFAMPTPSRQVTSRFGYRPAFRRMHKGLDIKVYTGDTIVSAFDGKVRVVRYDAGGYGNYVVIRHTNGLETIYGHLSKQLVSIDQEVKAGEP